MIPSTTAAIPTRRQRLRRSVSAAVLCALLVGGAACASEADGPAAPDVETDVTEAPAKAAAGEFEATAQYLHAVTDKSTSEGYHMDMYLSMTGDVSDAAPPMMSGEIDGAEFHYVMDLGPMMDEMISVMGEDAGTTGMFDGVDMSMEMAGDTEQLYVRAPMFSDPLFSTGQSMGGLERLGDGWGVVDIAALGDELPTEVAASLTSQGVDPRAIVDVIEQVGDVQDLGTGDIDGTAVHGMAAETTMADIIEASGQDPEALAAAGGSAGDAVEALYDTATSIEVWIDDEGYLRRTEFGWSFDDVFSAMGTDPGMLDGMGMGMGEISFAYRMDLSEYGSAVDFEPPADAVDITDEYTALLGL